MFRRQVISTIAVSAITSVLLSFSAVAGAQAPETSCGTPPDGYNVIETDSRFITGTTGPDFICAGNSNNIIRAKGQNDIIFAGGGNDVIWGGFGNDTVWAGDGNDLIRGGGGKDAIAAGDGADNIFGGDGPDTIRGEGGNDSITGGAGHDSIDGGDGDDQLIGNRGIDELIGGNGNDVVQAGTGTDTLVGGLGDDVLTGGDHDDILRGGNGNDRLLGGNGDDALIGGNGDDALIGGGNQDTLRGSGGDDILDGGNGLNTAIGGPGDDHCKNADTPATTCEFVDGIDHAIPPARIWLLVPSSGSPGVLVGGTSWTPDSEIDVTLLDAAGFAIGPATTVISDGTGYWEIVVPAASVADGAIMVGDSATGRVRVLAPALDSFTWDSATQNLSIIGEPGQSMEAQIFNPGNEDDLIFVEQMTFDAGGNASANFSEVPEIGLFQLRRADSDGDIEIHSHIATPPVVTPVVVEPPSVDVAILQIPEPEVLGIFIDADRSEDNE